MIRSNPKRILVLVIVLALFASIAIVFSNRKSESSAGEQGQPVFSVKVIPSGNRWGYRIYEDSTAVIEQLTVPGIAGNDGFEDREMAQKTGDLVKRKLDNGIFPPTISPQELDSLGVKY